MLHFPSRPHYQKKPARPASVVTTPADVTFLIVKFMFATYTLPALSTAIP